MEDRPMRPKCPKCRKEYKAYAIELRINSGGSLSILCRCKDCDTITKFKITQEMLDAGRP